MQAVPEGEGNQEKTPLIRILFTVMIAATLILFACFYNEYIHHLMIRSDYGSYNVYSWPRLMNIPVYLLFAVIGERKNGKYVPITSLCMMLIALLTVVLVGSQGAYWLNMCIFYITIAVYTCYYLLTFWRLAPGTRYPTLWAPFGRMLDSGMVLLTGAVHLSALPTPVVLGVDIVGAALVILMMAVNGDFNLTKTGEAVLSGTQNLQMVHNPQEMREPQEAQKAQESQEVSVSDKQNKRDAFELMRERYQLTLREMDVLQKLLLTEDELQLIADDLHISRRVLGRHITSIYQKTGAKSRVGLYQIYHAASQDT